MSVKSSLQFIKGIGPKRVIAFNSLGYNNPEDLLYNFPFDYLDRSKIVQIKDIKKYLNTDKQITIVCEIFRVEHRRTKFGKQFLTITAKDETGFINCLFFNGTHWYKNIFKIGDLFAFSSVVGVDKYDRVQFIHPEYDKLKAIDDEEDKLNWYEKLNTGQIVPKYHLNETLRKVGVEQRQIRRIMKDVVEKYSNSVAEYLPRIILNERKFPELNSAIKHLHFPENIKIRDESLRRIKYDEAFMFQMLIAFRRKYFLENNNSHICLNKTGLIEKFINNLHFKLTDSQQKVTDEILNDLSQTKPMHRMLQGDVGCGKTIVALLAILRAIENNLQVAFMVPTEILAEQHFHLLNKLLKDFGINIKLLIGSQSKKIKKEISEEINNNKVQLVIGTHTLIQSSVKFKNLGLIIIDEQHRFGVAQRAKLFQKGSKSPHLLVMTATPIPRSLAMTIYGDLNVSTINEMPKGRIPIKTFIRTENDKSKIFKFIQSEIKNGRQAYIVVPLIEESEKVNFKSVIVEYEKLKNEVFKGIKIGLIHGQLNNDEKNKVMESFEKNEIKILVSTTVIEVGIDVPNTTVMLIEDSEKYGLSQLHQLRGRIGRGEYQSYCILISKNKNINQSTELISQKRLQAMVDTSDGFKISEIDLKLRGSGELFGTKQSGEENFSMIDLKFDIELLLNARDDVDQILKSDPFLIRDENKKLKKIFENKFSSLFNLIRSG